MQKRLLAGRYQVLRPLGGGGFGQTFLASDNHLPCAPVCVVKQLKPKVTDPETLETAKRLFDREAETLYYLGHHPQIPRLLAHFEQEQDFYLIEEYIEGYTLDQELQAQAPLSEAEMLPLLHQLLQVLSFVHQNNVIHRDIKPANLIRRSQDGQVVLIDFGAVKQVSYQVTDVTDPYQHTSFTVAVGSPGYMPPEQQAFTPHYSSDVYAAGIVALQGLSGLSIRELPKDEHGEYTCASLKERMTVSHELETILNRMVRYDYRQRYKTATEALQALITNFPSECFQQTKPFMTGDTTTVPISPPSPPSQKQQEFDETTKPIAVPPSQSTTPTSPEPTKNTSIDEEFLERCSQELANFVGPMASMIVEDILSEYPQISQKELLEMIATEIPNPQQIEKFQQRFPDIS